MEKLKNVLKYVDAQEKSDQLLERFKTPERVFGADVARLKMAGLSDSQANFIKDVNSLFVEILADKLKDSGPVPVRISDYVELIKYLRFSIGNCTVEKLKIFYFNNKNILLNDETFSSGTINQTAIYPREILLKAAALDASSIILAHNHPSGDPNPSKADIKITKDLKKILKIAGVNLLDHLIVADDEKIFSMRQHKMI